MSQETRDALDAALLNVKASRRDLLKRLLIGGGAALLVPMSVTLADAQDRQGKGKGKGKGGKGKGKGKGKGGGNGGNSGNGKGKGKGSRR